MAATRNISFVLILMAAVFQDVCGQSKLYLSGGVSTVSGSGANIFLGNEGSFFKFNYPTFDAEYQMRVIGSFNFTTGISIFTAGYNTTDDAFSAASRFDATYLGIPLMARWNVANKNLIYLDFGVMPFYLAQANLTETFVKFAANGPITVEGDVTAYSNRFYYASKFQMLILMNRFLVGLYIITPSKGQSSLRGLDGHWGLNSRQSTYLLSNGFSDFSVMGVKAGIRIR